MIVTKRLDQFNEDIIYMTHVSRGEFMEPLNIVTREVIKSLSNKIAEELLKENDIKSMITIEEIKQVAMEAIKCKIEHEMEFKFKDGESG